MSVPVAPNNAPPFANAASGANHQRVKASSAITQAPNYFNPVPVGSVLGSGTTGTAYSEAITGTGGTSAYTFAVTSGALPTGLTLGSSGTISGIPTATGTFSFTVQVTDTNGFTGSQAFSIAIAAPAATGGGNYGFVC